MLCALHLENIAVITTLDIEFHEGLHILTGETGAGKSIIIDAINMLLGARGGKSLIRYGENVAICEGLFTTDDAVKIVLKQADIELEEEDLILSRTIYRDGKNVCRLNGRLIPISLLKTLAPHLINIHGQHDNQALLSPSSHIDFLDGFNKGAIFPLLTDYKNEYATLKSIRAQIKALSSHENEKEYHIDFLTKQTEELTKAKLRPSEYEELRLQIEEMENYETLSEKLNLCYDMLYAADHSAVDNLTSATSAMSDLSLSASVYQELSERLSTVKYELSDISDTIRDLKDGLEFDEGKLATLQNRWNLLNSLQKKYNTNIEGLIALLEKSQNELNTITLSSEKVEELYEAFEKQKVLVAKSATKISVARKREAASLESQIECELKDLNMPYAHFVIQIERSDKFLENGIDRVEFLISTNEGSPIAPLSKVASGGELSRVMLAMKTVLSKTESVGTLIFDEIDTGVSGEAAQKIAEKLAKIARFKQVLCVTHLAQIAAMADTHFMIKKSSAEGHTYVEICKLSHNEKLLELSRIMSGLSSDIATRHSETLLKNASIFKEKLS